MDRLEELHQTVAAMMEPGKGILASDESTPTLTKRFELLGIVSTDYSRAKWREMLFSAEGLPSWISGVILFDETLRQRTSTGATFPEFLQARGILPGIKVDTGAKPFAGHPGETITEGLDSLAGRVAEYYELGARFAKWRAVIKIGDGLPSSACVLANAHALARYAGICQEGGLVPIVEPEILMEGDHTIQRCAEVTREVLNATFTALRAHDVVLSAMILKPSMVVPGAASLEYSDKVSVAKETVSCYVASVPEEVGGIALLSGGQSDELATEHLNEMAQLGPLPWPLTFSYGRALQDLPMRAWLGKEENYRAGQDALIARARANSLAQRGLLEG